MPQKIKDNNYAFIDSQNLNLNVRSQGWLLDFARFRVYLKEKYSVSKAFLFIGYIEQHKKMYLFLEKSGYICVFKPTIQNDDGITKGNCDAELVLHTMIELNNFDLAVIVSGDGDFYCLVKYLIEQKKLKAILIPNKYRVSYLFKYKIFEPFIRYLNELKNKLQYRKRPHKDETL